MGDANRKYYSSKGSAIYSDFSTFAQGKALATANAIGFVRDFSDYGKIEVCEYGIGNGNFAKVFLDEVKKRDSAIYSRIHYSLFDISEKMISGAKKNLSAHNGTCSFSMFDASFETPSQQFDYCRINELLTDLPAELYFRKGKTIFNREGKAVSAQPIVSTFLSRIDEARLIPFNFTAEKFLLSLCDCGNGNSRIDLFDYGFYSKDDFLLPAEEWNRLMVREYGSQLTVDLNFTFIIASVLSCGFSPGIEKQKEYAERELGMPLSLSESESCLDYVRAKPAKGTPGIEEDDGFYHLRIGQA